MRRLSCCFSDGINQLAHRETDMLRAASRRPRPSLSIVLIWISFTILFWISLCVAAGRAIWFW
jgi:hypothetical protein